MAQQVFPSPPTGNQPVSSQASVDAELVLRSLRGDEAAFAALFDRHASRVYALAYQLLGDRTEAEDITQDAFLQALSALPTLRQPGAFGGWVARIATNASLSTLRRRGRLPQAELSEAVTATYPDPARWASPEAMGLAAEDRHSVHVTLKRLAPSHRAALALREIGGLSYAEIARALGTTAGGVEALLFRARARFRDEYHKVALGAATAQATTCTCQQAQEELAALADNALAEPRRMEVVSHVRHCDACRATLQAQRDARRLIVAVPLFVPSAIKLATMAKVGPLLSLYAIGGAAAGGAATAGMATGGAATAGMATGGAATAGMATGGAATAGMAAGGAATAGMATSGAATAGMAAGGAASSGAAVAGGAVAGGAAATGVAATSSVAAGGTAAGAIATGGVAASAAAVSTGVAGAASTAGTSALIPVLAGVGTAGPAAKVAAVLVVGAIVAGVVTEPHRGRVAAPHAHRPLVGRPSVAQGTPTPPPPSSVRYAATGATVLVGPSNVPQGLVSPTVVSWPTSAAGRGAQDGPPTPIAGATAADGSAGSPAVTPSLGDPSLATGQATVVAAPSATTTVPATVAQPPNMTDGFSTPMLTAPLTATSTLTTTSTPQDNTAAPTPALASENPPAANPETGPQPSATPGPSGPGADTPSGDDPLNATPTGAPSGPPADVPPD